MKMITSLTDITIQTQELLMTELENFSSQNQVYVDLEESDDRIDGLQLLKHINQQFDLIYKENKKRKYLLKEVAHYLIQK